MSAGGLQIDNYVWENCEDALVAGSGNPQVRAGVLRLVSALPGITVTHGTVDGQPTLTLTAGAAELGRTGVDKANPKVETGPAYQEAITINADTGIPLEIASGPAGKVDRHHHLRGDPGQPGRHRRRQVLTCRIEPSIPGQTTPWPGIVPCQRYRPRPSGPCPGRWRRNAPDLGHRQRSRLLTPCDHCHIACCGMSPERSKTRTREKRHPRRQAAAQVEGRRPSIRSTRRANPGRSSGFRRLLEVGDGLAVVPRPVIQNLDGLDEGPAQVGEAVLDPPWRFGMAFDQAVLLEPAQRLGEDLARDAADEVDELTVSAGLLAEPEEHQHGPFVGDDLDRQARGAVGRGRPVQPRSA